MNSTEWDNFMSSWKQQALAPAEQKSLDATPGAMAWLRGQDSLDTSSTRLVNAYQQSTWVYAAVRLLAESLANVPFKFETLNDEEIDQGPLVDLFRRPHPRLNRFQFWELVATWLCLRGEYFIAALDANDEPLNLQRPTRGMKIAKLCLLEPDKMTHRVYDNTLVAWQYTSNPQAQNPTYLFAPEEIIHDRAPNPFNDWRGFSPITVLRLAAESDYASAQFDKGLMMNNADTGVIVTTEQQMSPEQQLAIQKALQERKRRAGTADRPLFLFGGAKVEKPTLSNADMQFLEGRKFKRQEIFAVLGVPQELAGFTEDANRSVGDAARLNFMENRIAPLAARIAAAVEPIVKGIDPAATGEFDIEATPVMQAAQRARWDTAVKGFAMGYSANELNKALKLGMPDDKERDKKYLPFSLQEVGVDVLDAVPVLDDKKPAQIENESSKAIDSVLRLLAAPADVHKCGKSSTAYARAIQGSVKKKRSTMRNFFTGQQARVLERMEMGLNKSGYMSCPELTAKSIDDIFDTISEDEKLLARMTPLMRSDLVFGGAQVWKELGLDPNGFNIPPAKAIEFLGKREVEIKGINKTTFGKLKTSLQDGLGKGDTTEELIARVKEVYSEASDSQAETIAITETNIATNAGRFEGMQEAGVEKKGWNASNLENVRATHLQAEADYSDGIPIDEAFLVGSEELMFPGDPSGSPGNVINCRCFTFAVLPDKSAKACCPTVFLGFEEFVQGKGGTL